MKKRLIVGNWRIKNKSRWSWRKIPGTVIWMDGWMSKLLICSIEIAQVFVNWRGDSFGWCSKRREWGCVSGAFRCVEAQVGIGVSSSGGCGLGNWCLHLLKKSGTVCTIGVYHVKGNRMFPYGLNLLCICTTRGLRFLGMSQLWKWWMKRIVYVKLLRICMFAFRILALSDTCCKKWKLCRVSLICSWNDFLSFKVSLV